MTNQQQEFVSAQVQNVSALDLGSPADSPYHTWSQPLLCADYARSFKPSQVAGSVDVAAGMALRTHRETGEKAYVAQVGNVYAVFPTQSSVHRVGGRILGVADDDAYHNCSALPQLQSNPKRSR